MLNISYKACNPEIDLQVQRGIDTDEVLELEETVEMLKEEGRNKELEATTAPPESGNRRDEARVGLYKPGVIFCL